MKSVIVTNLQPEFEPVAVVWSDTMPDDAVQFKKGKFAVFSTSLLRQPDAEKLPVAIERRLHVMAVVLL